MRTARRSSRRTSAARSLLALGAVAALPLAGCEDGQPPAAPTASSVVTTTEAAASEPPATPKTTFSPARQVFDEAAMQDAVHQVLTEAYQVEKLGVVTCPPGKPVEKGLKFKCTAVIDGKKRKVPITVTSDQGDYDVGMPD